MKAISIPLAICFMLMITGITSGQKSELPDNSRRHGLGIVAGYTTGAGLAYRYQHERLTLQTSFLPRIRNRQQYQIHASVGALYLLAGTETIRLHSYASLYYYAFGVDYLSDPLRTNFFDFLHPYTARDHQKSVNAGLGLDFEFRVLDNLSFNLMFGYAAYNNLEHLNVTADLGLFYTFTQ
ncbi:MAG: hypothetical protein ACQES0_04120 [Bacteroidota bacterium]